MMHSGKPLAALILAKAHKPGPEGEEEGEGDEQGLDAAAEDLISAVHGKDTAGVVEALRNAFSILDSEPHEEGEHE